MKEIDFKVNAWELSNKLRSVGDMLLSSADTPLVLPERAFYGISDILWDLADEIDGYRVETEQALRSLGAGAKFEMGERSD